MSETTTYTEQEIRSRLGTGYLLGMTVTDENEQIPVGIFGETKPAEKLAGIFGGSIPADMLSTYLSHGIPENWVVIDLSQWDGATLLRAIDDRRIVPVENGLFGGYESAVDALERNLQHRQREARTRTDLMRHYLGENVYPCRKCGEDLLPDGLLRHECGA